MGIADLSYAKLQAIRSRGTTYAPFTGSGLPVSVVERLNTQMTTAKKGQLHVGAAKAVGGYLSMMEMVKTEKELKAADVEIKTTAHGKIIPASDVAKILIAQQQILRGAQGATGETIIDLADESAHAAVMDLKVAGLMEDIIQLKENPTIVYADPPGGFDFKLPDWLKLPDFGGKLAAVGAGVGVAIIVIIGIIAFAASKKND